MKQHDPKLTAKATDAANERGRRLSSPASNPEDPKRTKDASDPKNFALVEVGVDGDGEPVFSHASLLPEVEDVEVVKPKKAKRRKATGRKKKAD